jgi:hypothetical protein
VEPEARLGTDVPASGTSVREIDVWEPRQGHQNLHMDYDGGDNQNLCRGLPSVAWGRCLAEHQRTYSPARGGH